MTQRKTLPNRLFRVWAVAGLGAVLALPQLQAQAVPADAFFNGFLLNGDFLFELGGEDLPHAEIYKSDRSGALLLMSPELTSPLLVNPRTRSVEKVHLMKVAKREDGSIDLLADATLDRLGAISIEGQDVAFEVNGKPAKLKKRPYLLGLREGSELKSYKPEYDRKAEQYTPDPRYVSSLREQSKEVTVRTFFGSWCPACGRMVPPLLKVEDEIGDSKITFEYYGLPSPFDEEPEAKRLGIEGVPTAVVFVGGKEVGRLSGRQWQQPEASLNQMVKK